MTDPIRFTLDGREVEAAAGRDHLAGGQARGHRHPASVLAARARLPRRRQLPRLHGRGRGRARARRLLHPQARRRHEGGDRHRARRDRAPDGDGAAASPTSRRAPTPTTGAAGCGTGPSGWRWRPAASRPASSPPPDWSHPAMAVQLDACIQCTLCVRACREVQVNDVIGMAGRGHRELPVFDQGDPMGDSTCVACGECVQACPTGALMPASVVDRATGRGGREADREVDSVCPFCGVGCQITYHVRDDKIAFVTGRDGPANENRLCVKGRFGFDYAHSPQRLTKPLIRKRRRAQVRRPRIDPRDPLDALPRGELGGGAGASPPAASPRSATATAATRWPASARPSAATRRPTCSRSWSAPASTPTMSTTAPGCATPPRWRR